jgi:hypothetical protein
MEFDLRPNRCSSECVILLGQQRYVRLPYSFGKLAHTTKRSARAFAEMTSRPLVPTVFGCIHNGRVRPNQSLRAIWSPHRVGGESQHAPRGGSRRWLDAREKLSTIAYHSATRVTNIAPSAGRETS